MATQQDSGGPTNDKEYEDYLREMNDIEQTKEPSDPEDTGTDDELSKTPDGMVQYITDLILMAAEADKQ